MKRHQKTESDREGTERKGVLVSHICRDLQPSAWIFLLSHFVAARDVLTSQHASMCRPGNETQQSTIFVVRSGTAGTNPSDSTFNLYNL